MAGSIPPQSNFGSFVPTTNIWDVQQIQGLSIDPQLKELLVRLYQNINVISLSLNTRDAGYYALQEFINGQIYFPNPNLNSSTPQSPNWRQVFRKVVNFGALPNATSKSVSHNIVVTPGYSLTRLYAAATNDTQTSFIPIPFASPVLNENIRLEMTDTDMIITTGIDMTAYTKCYIVAEYIKS
jgi:hypothetical protein